MKESVLNGFFFLFLGLIVLNRVLLFIYINQDCIDNDQVVMWAGTRDFSNGEFHVPRFYGQDYSTMIEALVAVPFVKLGMHVYDATPLSTHILFLFPFLIAAIYLFIKQKKLQAIVVLAIILCMPLGYDIMNSIPRGFVTGLFFMSLFIFSLYKPENLKLIAINTFLSYVAYLVNPNSVIVSAPLLVYLFFTNYKNKAYYVYTGIGILAGIPLDFVLNHFYKTHPGHCIYGFTNEYALSYFVDAITHLDKRFAHIGLFAEETCIPVIILLALVGWLTYQRNKRLFLAFLIVPLIIIISFFSSKAADGAMWSFYSYSRLYLGIPLIVALLLSFSDLKKIAFVIIPVTILFTLLKESNFKEQVAYHSDERKWDHLNLITLKDLKDYLGIYKDFCEKNNAKAIIIDHAWRDDFINYAGPAIDPDYPVTFKPSFERRTWRIKEEETRVYERFILYMADYRYDEIIKQKKIPIEIEKLNDYGIFLIKNNKYTTHQFLNLVGMTLEKGL